MAKGRGRVLPCARYLCRPVSESSSSMSGVKAPTTSRSFWFLCGGGAPGSPAVQGAGHVGTANAFVRTQNTFDRRTQDPPAKAGGRATRRHTRRVGRAHGLPVSDFADGFVAAPAGFDL